MEQKLGILATFPDTSNNRFQTHALAAEQLIINLEVYKEFLLQVKDRKEKRNWNNLEQNLWDGLNDLATLEELAALAVYSQTISVPYVAHIRENPKQNALDMGPYHDKVLIACKAVIDDPDVVLGMQAFHTPATLGGQQFHCPEVMYAVHRLAPLFPHLSPLVQRFFTGAYKAWPRFMTEFIGEGSVSQLTAEERKRAGWNNTNDLNESAFGIQRRNWRFAGNTSLLWHNACVMYKMNGTGDFILEMDKETWAFLRKEARRRMEVGEEKENRKRQAEYDLEIVTDKRKRDAKHQKKLDDDHHTIISLPTIYITPESFPKKFTIADIVLQLNWHRSFSPARAEVPKKSHCGPTRAKLLETLVKVMEKFRESGKSVAECMGSEREEASEVVGPADAEIEDEDIEDYKEFA